jgi:uracil DNA glycosylase
MKYEAFEPLLYKWGNKLKPFIESEKCDTIYKKLKADTKTDKICPEHTDVFHFLKTDPDNLKVLLIGLDPYPGRYKNMRLHATGIAFDNRNSPDKKCQLSLIKLHEGFSNEEQLEYSECHSLEYLINQGVMLSNRALTVKYRKTESHIGLWDSFWEFFIQEVIQPYYGGLPIVLLGDKAKILKKYIWEMSNPIFYLTHPSTAARTDAIWETNNTFKKINTIIKQNGQDPIIWHFDSYKNKLNEQSNNSKE